MHNMSAQHKAWHKIFAFSDGQAAYNVDTAGYVTQNYALKCKKELHFPQGNGLLQQWSYRLFYYTH